MLCQVLCTGYSEHAGVGKLPHEPYESYNHNAEQPVLVAVH